MDSISAVLLGAGASCQLGMPLVWELTQELRAWLTPSRFIELNDHWKTGGVGHVATNVDLVCQLLTRDDLHFENLIGAIEVEILRSAADVPRYQDLHGIRMWLLEMIYYLFYYRQVLNSRYMKPRLPLYSGFRALAERSKPLWVFSLNYDMTFESIAAHLGIQVKSGFPRQLDIHYYKGSELRTFAFDLLTREDLTKGNYAFFSPGQLGINLMKLHGSLDLFAQHDEREYLRMRPPRADLDGINLGLRTLNEEMIFRPFNVNATNTIMYLDEAKVLQFLQRSILTGVHKFQNKRIDQIAPPEFLPIFESHLNYAEKLYTFGYAFGDYHVNSVVRNWLSFAGRRRLVVVDPVPRIPSDFGHLAMQIEQHRMLTTDYLISVSDASAQGHLRWLNRKCKIYSRIGRSKAFQKAFKAMVERLRMLHNKLI